MEPTSNGCCADSVSLPNGLGLELDEASQQSILSLLTSMRGLIELRDWNRKLVAEKCLRSKNLGRLSFRANRYLDEGKTQKGFGEKQSKTAFEAPDKLILFFSSVVQ